MTNWMKTTTFALAVGALALASTAPAEAQRWRGRVAAGVAAGVVGGAIIGSLAARPYGYGYYDPGYAYAEPAYPAYGYGPAPAYGYGPGYTYYGGPVYSAPRYYGYVPRGSTGLRSGVTRTSPHYDY